MFFRFFKNKKEKNLKLVEEKLKIERYSIEAFEEFKNKNSVYFSELRFYISMKYLEEPALLNKYEDQFLKVFLENDFIKNDNILIKKSSIVKIKIKGLFHEFDYEIITKSGKKYKYENREYCVYCGNYCCNGSAIDLKHFENQFLIPLIKDNSLKIKIEKEDVNEERFKQFLINPEFFKKNHAFHAYFKPYTGTDYL